MNINQVKAVAGIPKGQSVSGRKNLLAAIEHCKRGIVAAHPDRTGGNSTRAAALSEAQQFFKDRLRGNRCEVCGERITATAKRCRMHTKKRALPGPENQQPARQKPSRRIDVSPEGGWIARYGFYAGPVQKVVRRWAGKVSPSRIQGYFKTIAATMLHRHKPITLSFDYVGPNDWGCVFELGQALDDVLQDKSKAESWLIRFPIWVATDGRQDDWPKLAARIQQQGGPAFKPNSITQVARRLRMLTPKSIQESYRRATATL